MKHLKNSVAASLAENLAVLPKSPRAELLQQWTELYGSSPPAYISHGLLVQAVAYKLQEKVYGGIKPATRRILQQVAANAAAGKHRPIVTPKIRAGTRLLREWHGVTYEVVVQEDGKKVLLNGKPFKSLSAAAQKITGAKWSGPLFFGLKTGRKSA